MLKPEVIDALVAAGCTVEQLAAAVKADLRGARDSNAERQARHRAKLKADPCESVTESNARNVTPVTVTDDVTDGSLSPVPLLPPIPPNNPLTPKLSEKNNTRGHRMPADWTMSGPDLAYALGKGFSEQRTCELFEKFCNWAHSASGPNAVKRNWHRAWQNWVLSEAEKTPANARAGPPGRPLTAFQQRRQETQGILDDLDNFARGGGQGCEADTRLLSGHSGERSEGFCGGVGADVIDLPASGYRTSR